MGKNESAPEDDPLHRHHVVSDDVVRSGDECAIKTMYVELGRDFWKRVEQGDDYVVPVLSAPETLAEVVPALSDTFGRILDAGCGPHPAVAISLSRHPSRSVVALDLGWEMVRTATSVAADSGVVLLGVAGDVENLPFRSNAFDGLVCDDTIEHLPNDVAGVTELARVLRPQALAILATPNRHSAAVVYAKFRDTLRGVRQERSSYFVASSHLREYTWREFERLVRPCFRVERRRPVGWRSGRKRKWITPLLHLPSLHRVSQMIVLQCRARKVPDGILGTDQELAPRSG